MANLMTKIKGGYNLIRLIGDLERTDQVFGVVKEMATPEVLKPILQKLVERNPLAANVLQSRPRMPEVNLLELQKLPVGTLGRGYADFMLNRGLDPHYYPAEKAEDETKFFTQHLYETHDIWHVVTGFSSSQDDEIGLQAFYSAQLPLSPVPPILVAAGLLNAALFRRDSIGSRWNAIIRGWNMGRAAQSIFGVPWHEHWEKPIVELQREFNILPALQQEAA